MYMGEAVKVYVKKTIILHLRYPPSTDHKFWPYTYIDQMTIIYSHNVNSKFSHGY